jgi:hypothetical protein
MLGLARVLVLVGGLGIAAIGLLVGGLGLLSVLIDPSGQALAMATASVSFLALAVGLGLSLAWQAGQAIAGRQSGRFRPRRIWIWLLLFVAALVLGQLALSSDLAVLLTFPFFHVMAASLPPLVILALMGRGLGGAARWRDVVLETGSGAFLSTFLAFSLEFAAILGIMAAGLAIVAMRPGGVTLLQTLASRLQDPGWLQNPSRLASFVESPIILAAVLLFLAGIIPTIEETVKTLGVGLLAYRHPSMPEAVVWGLAGGAGFALAEGLFNSISGLDAWAGVVMLRVGASMLHCFTGGLMGLGWYYLLAERRWWRTLGLYTASVALHGLWNALAAGMTLISLRAAGEGLPVAPRAVTGLGSFAILALLLLLTLGVVFGLVALARHARRHGPVPKPPLGEPAVVQVPAPPTAGAAGEQT